METIDTETLNKLKEKIEQAEKKVTLAEGAIEEIKKQWAEDFECENEEQVKELKTSLESQIEKLETKFNEGLNELKEKVKKFEGNNE